MRVRSIATWIEKAACRQSEIDPEIFFEQGTRAAKQICVDCLVRYECLGYAVVHDEYGVWGGKTRRERQKLPVVSVRLLVKAYLEAGLIERRLDAPPNYYTSLKHLQSDFSGGDSATAI